MADENRKDGNDQENNRLNTVIRIIDKLRILAYDLGNDSLNKAHINALMEKIHGVHTDVCGPNTLISPNEENNDEYNRNKGKQKVGNVSEKSQEQALVLTRLHSTSIDTDLILSAHFPKHIIDKDEIEDHGKDRHTYTQLVENNSFLNKSDCGIKEKRKDIYADLKNI